MAELSGIRPDVVDQGRGSLTSHEVSGADTEFESQAHGLDADNSAAAQQQPRLPAELFYHHIMPELATDQLRETRTVSKAWKSGTETLIKRRRDEIRPFIGGINAV